MEPWELEVLKKNFKTVKKGHKYTRCRGKVALLSIAQRDYAPKLCDRKNLRAEKTNRSLGKWIIVAIVVIIVIGVLVIKHI